MVTRRRSARRACHVLIAVLERLDEQANEIISSLPGIREITAAVIHALTGQEDT
jgi:hypothetical protein